ncbi:MAG TPA: outer membrane protein transport protein [Bacteroidales bacterium]|nr:outer membrane protein transport protein [Bacteroidales bacterium]
MKRILYMMMILIITSPVYAGGYQVRLQGHRQTAMGLVGVSLFGDASNIFYNPAGLSLMRNKYRFLAGDVLDTVNTGLSLINNKYSFMVGGSGILNSTTFRLENSVYQAETDNPMGTPLFFYGAAKITDRLAVGIGVYTPYGSSAKWGDDWAGAHLIQDISLKAFFFQPTISYKISDMFSLGAGLVIATGSVEINKAIPYNSAEELGQVNLQGTTTSFGYNLGAMFTPNEQWSIGVNYRSLVKMTMDGGDATFTVPSSMAGIVPPTNTFDAELPLPANLDLGVAYQVTEKLLLSVEVNYVFWDVYDTLTFEFAQRPELLNSKNPREYSNKLIYRIGGEYIINNLITLRAGAYYDPSPTNKDYFNPETPSLNTIGLSAGLTIRPSEHLAIDISYLHLETQKDTRSYMPEYFTGEYKTRTMIPGIGISYNF